MLHLVNAQFAFLALPNVEFTGVTLDQQQGTFALLNITAVVGETALGCSSHTPTDEQQCVTSQCRFAFGTAPAAGDGGLAAFAMGALFPAAGQIASMSNTFSRSLTSVPIYLYGMESICKGDPKSPGCSTGESIIASRCPFIGVAVKGSVESMPFIQCVNPDSPEVLPKNTTSLDLGLEYGLVTSGTWSSHHFEYGFREDLMTYYVVGHSKLDSAVFATTLVFNGSDVVMSMTKHTFTADATTWGAKGIHINPIVDLIWRKRSRNTKQSVLAVVATHGATEPVSPTDPSAVGRRTGLYIASLDLSTPVGGATVVSGGNFSSKGFKAGAADQPAPGSYGFSFAKASPASDVTMVYTQLIPGDDNTKVALVRVPIVYIDPTSLEKKGIAEEKEELVTVKQLPPVVQWDWIFPDCFTPLIVPWALQM